MPMFGISFEINIVDLLQLAVMLIELIKNQPPRNLDG
jgi:hypothetical protein